VSRNADLSIEVSTGLNPKVMRVFDTSFYYADESIENYLVEVLPVNKEKWVTFYVKKGFSLVLNSSNLRYKVVSDHDQLVPLPDGIYELKLSYKPNAFTVCGFIHFRITTLLSSIQKERTKLLADKCSLERREYLLNRDRLRDIEEYVQSAQWIVEEDGDKEKGKELYEYAKKLLEQYSNECQC
jgi:hypothetical protein